MLEFNAGGELAAARGRGGAVRRVAGEQRRLGAVPRPLLGHAAAGLGRAIAIRAHVEVIGSYAELAANAGASRCRRISIPTSPSSTATPGPAPVAAPCAAPPRSSTPGSTPGRCPMPSGTIPSSTRQEFATHFPADYICEGVDQTRGWFYSLLAIATTAFDSPAYRQRHRQRAGARCRGPEDVEEQGERRQSLGDDRRSSAPIPCGFYLLASSQVWLPKRFDKRQIPQVTGDFFHALRNSYEFFRLVCHRDRSGPTGGGAPRHRPLDSASGWVAPWRP